MRRTNKCAIHHRPADMLSTLSNLTHAHKQPSPSWYKRKLAAEQANTEAVNKDIESDAQAMQAAAAILHKVCVSLVIRKCCTAAGPDAQK